MKKQYIAPAISIMAINIPEMICTSINEFNLNGDDETDACYVRGRGVYDDWDDLWDEE